MPTVQDLTDRLEKLAPLPLQASYDNAGLLVGDAHAVLTGVLVSLDATEAIVHEAQERGCNLIVSHHPIIFSGLRQITGRTYVERSVMAALRARVSLYAIHTNLDQVWEGVNARLCQQLGLEPEAFLDESSGAGMLGVLPEAMPEPDFLAHLKASLRLPLVRHTALRHRPVQRVAVCGGAGSFLLEHAVAAKADFFITSDYKYHQFFDAQGRIVIADVGHYESEIGTVDLLLDYLGEHFPDLPAYATQQVTNPVNYYF
ncbi:MAG: Nif3-like dinuclear metal center hexameric protein [Bernardetiaceae bacterium]